MRIVIDIPDDMIPTKQEIIDTYIHFINGTVCEVGGYGFMVLPKGHGDLIDRDALNLDYEVSMADDWKTAHEIANCVKYAPTVIDADKGERNEDSN